MPSKEELIRSFNPNGPGIKGNLFGFPFTPENSSVVIVPIPWDVTVSYTPGTALGPQAVLNASVQMDSHRNEFPHAWKLGVSMLPVSLELTDEGSRLRELALKHIERVEAGEEIAPDDPIVNKINEASENLNIYVKATTQKYLKEKKLVGILGGDHSTPLGFIRALSEQYNRFGILQIDAHADLRKAYEGFWYSHASIMYNALKIPAVNRIVQVGVRDSCEEEAEVVNRAMGRIKVFYDDDMKARQYGGETWLSLCDEITRELPDLVYVSFDIDGLDPKLCPATGTPVPGGLEFQQAIQLLKSVVRSGKKIIGFDLCEVAPGATEWDANVGARMLYQLVNWMAASHSQL
jgi:agmatinase